ncbi:MAG TPA: amylo-alpha-1,6-glucosidase [Vineibacter sp.]|nr:amylo-alpha-1,6-glucosidase [Vineibacter sp.]
MPVSDAAALTGVTGQGSGDKSQFFVPALVGQDEHRPHVLKQGDTFAVFDRRGDAVTGPASSDGLFHRDTRFLSHLRLAVGGAAPILLQSTLNDDNTILTCDLTNPDLYDQDGRVVLMHDLIHIRRSRFLWNAACLERLTVRNFDRVQRELLLQVAFAADFADLFEVRGTRRHVRGTIHAPMLTSDSVTLGYTGLDRVVRKTALTFDPSPSRLDHDLATFEILLPSRESRSIFMLIQCDADDSSQTPRRMFFSGLRAASRARRRVSSRRASPTTSNAVFNETVQRSLSDLDMLSTDTEHGPYPYAGIPWFSTVFGRDALITALQTLWLDPTIGRGVLRYLASRQATTTDPTADAQPGKILHEVRHGEMAQLGEVPFRYYYGSVDSTPLFVVLAGAYLARTGDVATIRHLWTNISSALQWIESYGDCDGDGFVEYGRMSPDGLVNQGWKDSHDSIFHGDGYLARGPIALVEVQAYVYGAWRAAAEIAHALGSLEDASAWRNKAEAFRRQFDISFFDEALGTYVLALDGDKQACRVLTSNAGHALFTGLAYPERAKHVVRTLTGSSLFSGWGIRTVATTEVRYNPISYHNGSVWPHDNALIAAGFARYGFHREVLKVFEALFAASSSIDLRRLPELFCGFPRKRNQGPTSYPVACSPQAWAAAAHLSLIQSSLGLGFDPQAGNVIFDRPVLPTFLNEIVLRRLSLNDATIDVVISRTPSGMIVANLSRQGNIGVLANT